MSVENAFRYPSYFIRHFSALGNLKFIWIALAYRKGSFVKRMSSPTKGKLAMRVADLSKFCR